ncbi:putative diguanylate cyclase YegE [Vibrio aerogenes CECT 7868]|uniref:Putative diguanylate cyclase YegE n=2 Tax=Vibrio aerogenes TaxID=92172 RepID=A0A1M5WTY9_9VIBR|nr:putative diguanylate cyclase YegE [Vibrio aerogenes CECT 7868]
MYILGNIVRKTSPVLTEHHDTQPLKYQFYAIFKMCSIHNPFSMLKPKRPENEQNRLTALRHLNVLDTPPEERFDRITRLARRLFDVPIALVSLVDENRQWFKSCFGLDAQETSRDISFCGHTILENQPFIVPDASKDLRFADNPLVTGAPHIRFYAGVPLHYQGCADEICHLGTLCIIDQTPKYMSEAELADLIDLARLAERELSASHIASIDELTHIQNRRGFISLAQKASSFCQRENKPYSLAYIDLNQFKPINDQFGHAEGDKALQMFAQLMQESFRESDVIARMGGDEFVVLMPGIDEHNAQIAINRFRTLVNQYNQDAGNGYDIIFCEGLISVSPGHHQTIEALLCEADKLMYQNKNIKSSGTKPE